MRPSCATAAACGLALLCGFLFFYCLADRDLWNSHEARAAQDAQNVLDGDWALPHLHDGQPELQKPPLYYWLAALFTSCRGGPVDAWTVRLPSALAALACVLLLYGAGARQGRPLVGFLAAGMLATALHFTWLARVARIDMPLTFTVALAVLAFAAHRRRGRSFSGELLLGYVALAAGLLLKGPIGAALPVATAGMLLAVEGELPAPWRPGQWLRLLHRFGLWWGVPLVLALTVPWCWWANHITDGEWFRVFFLHHNVERGFGGAEVEPGHPLREHPWWLYGPLLLWDFLPWSVLLPAAGWCLVRYGWWRQDREARLGVVWLLTMTALLSCARFKRDDYLVPAYPGAALLLGCVAERWYRAARRPAWLAIAFGVVVAGCVVGWWINVTYVVPRKDARWESQRFAAEIRARSPAPQTVVFFRTEAHALAFHVGRPLRVFVEWQDLDALAARPETSYVVMPAASAEEWPRFLKAGRLEEVLRTTSLPEQGQEKPLVLLRTRPAALSRANGCPSQRLSPPSPTHP